MRRITKIIFMLAAVIMLFSVTSVCAFASPSIHGGSGDRDSVNAVLNTLNIHEEQVAGVEYKLSPVLELKEMCKVTTGDPIKEWITTNEADTLDISAGDYELSVVSTPKNYFATNETVYFSVDADGVIKTFDVDWYGKKCNEAVVEANILNNVLHYRDGFVVKNETGKQNKFYIAQKIGKNIISTGDTSAIVTVYNADGTAKQGESGFTFEKVRNRVNLYEVTLEAGEYIELYDIHSEGFYVFAEKTDGSNVFKFDDGDKYSVYNKEDEVSENGIKLYTTVVDSKIDDWQAAVVYPTLNDPAGEGFNLGGTAYAWGRSSVPHVVVLTAKEKPAALNSTEDTVHTENPVTPVVNDKPATQEEEIKEENINEEAASDEKETLTDEEESTTAEEITEDGDTLLSETVNDNEKNGENTKKPAERNSNIPNTGDKNNILIWITLLFASVCGIAGTSYSVKRKEK